LTRRLYTTSIHMILVLYRLSSRKEICSAWFTLLYVLQWSVTCLARIPSLQRVLMLIPSYNHRGQFIYLSSSIVSGHLTTNVLECNFFSRAFTHSITPTRTLMRDELWVSEENVLEKEDIRPKAHTLLNIFHRLWTGGRVIVLV
jgi:hypothetical protein